MSGCKFDNWPLYGIYNYNEVSRCPITLALSVKIQVPSEIWNNFLESGSYKIAQHVNKVSLLQIYNECCSAHLARRLPLKI